MMTLEEWCNMIKAKLIEAGFTVIDYEGFPMVTAPATTEDQIRLMDLPMPSPCYKTVYMEGLLFTPMPMRGY